MWIVFLYAILTKTTKRQNFLQCSPQRKRSNAFRIRRSSFDLPDLFLPAFLIECFKSCVPIDRNFPHVKIPLLLRGCHNSYEQSLGQDVLFQIKDWGSEYVHLCFLVRWKTIGRLRNPSSGITQLLESKKHPLNQLVLFCLEKNVNKFHTSRSASLPAKCGIYTILMCLVSHLFLGEHVKISDRMAWF